MSNNLVYACAFLISAMAAQAKNIQLQPIKIENTTSYRNPVQPQTYPSPPYEANYNNHSGASVYQTYTAAINQNQQRSFPVSQYLATNHNLSNQSNGTYNPNPISPFNGAKPNQGPVFNQSMVNQGSSGHQLVFESVANANGNNGDSMGQGQRFNQSYGESRQQRHSCDVAAKQHQMQQQDMTNPYSQVSQFRLPSSRVVVLLKVPSLRSLCVAACMALNGLYKA